jgi:ABC-type nickel/cobalt efflux system permease component RcnA
MVRPVIYLLCLIFLILAVQQGIARHPFHHPGGAEQLHASHTPQGTFLETIAFWQQQLKEKMVPLVRDARTTHNVVPLLAALMIAFGYGVLHAAGPGHGKVVTMSYVLSRNASMGSGLLFGTLIAFSHGFSAVICVLAIRYIIQKGFFGTFETISHTTQIVSFSLIALIGLGILLKSGYSLFGMAGQGARSYKIKPAESKKAFVPWAVAIGLVPCPAVVMVLLFCLSMNMLSLGILLAGFISLGMACTISTVVVVVIMGKDLSLTRFPEKRIKTVEGLLGMGSGIAVMALGLLFLGAVIA